MNTVADYLVFLLRNTTNEYSAVNTARSALSSFLPSLGGVPVGQHTLIKRVMRGVFKEKPALPKYTKIFDTNIVLDYLDRLGSSQDISLPQLTERLATLTCLLSGHRDQTISLLDVRDICFTRDMCTMVVNKLTKVTRPGFHIKPMEFKKFTYNDNLCVMSNTLHYLERTFTVRGTHVPLFISPYKPHKPVSVSSISRWVKRCLNKAGVDTSVFGAHSTRAASTSQALRKGISMSEICRAAGWSNCTTFARHYNKPIIDRTFDEGMLEDFKRS